MPTHTVQLLFKTDAGQVPLQAVPYVVDTEINETILVPAGQTVEFDVTFAHAKINDYAISANGSVTVAWNSTTTPVPQMVLTKTPTVPTPVSFHAPDFGGNNLFTSDVTKGYAVNGGLVDVTLTVHIGLNEIV